MKVLRLETVARLRPFKNVDVIEVDVLQTTTIWIKMAEENIVDAERSTEEDSLLDVELEKWTGSVDGRPVHVINHQLDALLSSNQLHLKSDDVTSNGC